MVVAMATDVGGRESNEDALLVEELGLPATTEGEPEPAYLLAIADGMGGYERGEVASKMAIEVVREMFLTDPGADTALLLKQAFRRANERIYENGQGGNPPAMMGTTLVVTAARGKYATIASIGDSRAYLARANRITQITKDHSLVAEQVAQGLMTAEEARESPHRNILTHALGHRPKLDSKMPNIFEITLLPEDRLLLCTDGFSDVVPDSDLLNALVTTNESETADRLVRLAVERGASDNVTAVVLSVLPAREPTQIAGTGGRRGLSPALLAAVIALVVIVLAVAIFLLL
jgi:protein phosphatase